LELAGDRAGELGFWRRGRTGNAGSMAAISSPRREFSTFMAGCFLSISLQTSWATRVNFALFPILAGFISVSKT
jgi:hypothetical protein